MLNFLSSGNQKQIVGISLTPGIGLEAAILNKATMTVVNYGVKKVDYNFSNREIQNYTQFKTAFAELMDEMRVPAKSAVYFVLPNVYFDFIELPSTTPEADLKNVFLSKAEEFYLFKKEEPVSGWQEVANIGDEGQKRWAYTSIQKSVVDQIKEITADLGLQLVGIESDYSATLRGMQVAGLIDDVIFENSPWTVMLINANSYVLFQMDGKTLVTCSEVPLAVRSYSTEEAYDSIVASSAQLLKGFETSTKLYIISQTDEISAELLKSYMDFVGEITAINTNKHATESVVNFSPAVNSSEMNQLTLGTIGATSIHKKASIILLNVLADDPSTNLGVYCTVNVMGQELEVTNEVIQKLCIALALIIGIVFGSIIGFLAILNNTQTKQLADINSSIKKVDAQISQFSEADKKPEIDITNIIDEVAKQNITAISFYDSIATDIPKNVWLTKYYNKDGDKIAIRGVAQNIIDIYDYYRNLRLISSQSDIKLTELKVLTDSLPDTEEGKYIESLVISNNNVRLYSFEISNIQIDFTQKQVQQRYDAVNPENGEGISPIDKIRAEEAVIIKRNDSPGVEQTSGQMTPAE